MIEDRAIGALLGLAVGDALGATLEFKQRDREPELVDMVGGGPFNLKAGEWTDDTSMALCLADTLVGNMGLDELDLMRRFARWYHHGDNSCTGRCFDIGNTTREAIRHYERTGEIGVLPPGSRTAGNGSLMRLSPVAIYYADSVVEAVDAAERQSLVTHPDPITTEACRYFAGLLVEAINGADKAHVLRPADWGGMLIEDTARGVWRGRSRDQVKSSGYVVDTLEAALWCVERSNSFDTAVLLAANLADDADTVAAVTGQLAGAFYGAEAIPTAWRTRVAWEDRIINRVKAMIGARALFKALPENRSP